MDGQKSQAKLTRTQSSLLRSSPTVRSSFHSLPSFTEEDQNDEEQQKTRKPHSSCSSQQNGSTRFANPVIVLASLTCFTLFSLLFYIRNEDTPTSENLLLALILIAIVLFVANKNKNRIRRTLSIFKQTCNENTKRFGFSKTNAKPVLWFIGNSNENNAETQNRKKLIREAVEFYSNGDFYEGEFHKGKCNGSGVYYYFVNGKYEGDWIDGRYDGYGIESWAKGSRYRGQYRQGLRHGFGVYRFFTGDSYAGEWCNGQSHGFGVQTCSDFSSYVGEFKCGVKHGLGCYHFRNGDRYVGEYFSDKIHGFGVYHFANGHYYEGSWHEGRKQGYGMYTFRNGHSRCGEWDGGNLKHSLPPLSEAILRAVKAARKTAESAIKPRRVDEEVNKSVMAANKAATAARVAATRAVQNRKDGKFCDTYV